MICDEEDAGSAASEENIEKEEDDTDILSHIDDEAYKLCCDFGSDPDPFKRSLAAGMFKKVLCEEGYSEEVVIKAYNKFEEIYLQEQDIEIRGRMLEEITTFYPDLLYVSALNDRPRLLLEKIIVSSLKLENETVLLHVTLSVYVTFWQCIAMDKLLFLHLYLPLLCADDMDL
uniref:MI domain-containing protein n=1 Tax=Syphacia muris TaxID=451379 RepID=A0A0N5A929_9BILA